MILIKLGGSIITNKEKPLSARRKTINNLTKSLKKINEPIIIGSFIFLKLFVRLSIVFFLGDNGFSLFVIIEPPNFIRIMLPITKLIKKYSVL